MNLGNEKITPELLAKITPEQRTRLTKLFVEYAKIHSDIHNTLMKLNQAIETEMNTYEEERLDVIKSTASSYKTKPDEDSVQ